jgi:predicted P-loop ATPase
MSDATSDDWLRELDSTDPASEVGWKTLLITNQKTGVASGGVANAIIALRHAPEWNGVLAFDQSAYGVVARLKPPFEKCLDAPFKWADHHDIQTAAWLQHQGISVNNIIAGQALQTVAMEHPFHPIRDYLNSLKWDGARRIDGWLTRYLGVEPSEYVSAIGPRFLIGAVARIFHPGGKNDTCPILEGEQGKLKSTAVRTLAGDAFFSDDISELGSKDSVLQTRGVWIIELSELDSMSRADISRVKGFMTRQVDRIRPPYGRRVIDAPRECVFIGTTNRDVYLKDETGGRRFWPVRVGKIDIDSLGRDRDQLWAEAGMRFNAGESWWLDTKELSDLAAQEVQSRYEGDPWDEPIKKWIEDRDDVSIPDVLEMCLAKPKGTWNQADQNRVARCLIAADWKRFRRREGGMNVWKYRPKPKN